MKKYMKWICAFSALITLGLATQSCSKNEGYDIITPMVICNTQDFEAVEGITGIHVYPGEDCLKIRKE